jgi:hypothetical protein
VVGEVTRTSNDVQHASIGTSIMGRLSATVMVCNGLWPSGRDADSGSRATPQGQCKKIGDPLDLRCGSPTKRWIVNSRNTADEDAVRTLASLAGFRAQIAHQIDSLELVEDLILAGHGIGLLPLHRPTRHGLKVLPLSNPGVTRTAFAVTRRGRSDWAPTTIDTQPHEARWCTAIT